MDLLIQHVRLNGKPRDVLIQNGRFSQIAPRIDPEALSRTVQKLDGDGLALLPSFANVHCHTAMVLMRGLGDGTPLHEWLNDIIWPMERRLTGDHIYWGTLFGCLEMIRSGITAVCDMYWQTAESMRAFYESGLRVNFSHPNIIPPGPDALDGLRRDLEAHLELAQSYPARVELSVGIHALYSTSADMRAICRDFAAEHHLLLQTHISETRREHDECLKTTGKTPAELFDAEGLLNGRFLGAHGVWLTDSDRRLLVERGAAIAHCPSSNMKLASGIFIDQTARAAGLRFGLGTDGASSNNRYDMFSEMRTAALLAKVATLDPTACSAAEIHRTATLDGFQLMHLDAGEIAVGKLADCLLVNLDHTGLVPDHDLISNLVYAATPECVDTTICNGRILMHHRQIPGEDEIRRAFRDVAATLL
ncbi:MAG TPA: amidohydrolase [Kiritimatiellia bacterium]|nr:amidohydrolase [Kiritimatiellia bacterium]HPJ56599.1 amidohydrolase [Kiritimatiellia bacterium]HPR68388.1 amidohydrolase [Kiritimatiellia bacterium]